MDSSAVNTNLTIDDFDSILSYADQSAWQTPDPSSASFDAKGSEWLMGTYHSTDVVNASVNFNFTGPAIYIFGASGPDYGSVELVLDGQSTVTSAYSASNASSPYILYSNSGLAYTEHTLTLRNLGKRNSDGGGNKFLLDFLRTTVQLAPPGATATNHTLEETDANITYSGTWGNNKSPNFSGGGSTYTNEDNASFELQFNASAIYVFGDKKNDHGLYTVSLDSGAPQTFDGVSGCGGAFAMTCEQQQPTLAYFASNLDGRTHTLKLTNLAGANASYFDLDSIVLSVPSVYAPRNLSTTGDSTASSSGSPSQPGPSTSASATPSSASRGAVPPILHPLLLLLGFLWVIYGRRGRIL
ncbi:hypothetical protein C8F01DRAFT_1183187 [Mycena amicta]|nr:hypothetical protein C8F01DRAFT_1183187 [Mycena amicta]